MASKPRAPARRLSRTAGKLAAVALLTGWSVVALLPVITTAMASVRSQVAIVADPVGWPDSLRFDNFVRAWSGPVVGRPLLEYAGNSVLLVGVALVVAMACGTLAAYGIWRATPRLDFAYRYFLALVVLPPIVAWVPLFGLADRIGITNSPGGVGLVEASFAMPTVVVLMRAYFSGFPKDVVDAARVDGANELTAFLHIVVPMCWGHIGVVGLIQAVALWNELPLALILLSNGDARTLPLGIIGFRSQFGVDLGAQFAAILLSLSPMAVLFLLMKRPLLRGMFGSFGSE